MTELEKLEAWAKDLQTLVEWTDFHERLLVASIADARAKGVREGATVECPTCSAPSYRKDEDGERGACPDCGSKNPPGRIPRERAGVMEFMRRRLREEAMTAADEDEAQGEHLSRICDEGERWAAERWPS